MPNLVVVDRTGVETVIENVGGLSVMEAIRDNGIDELAAICGGACSCATCHVYVDPDAMDRLPLITEDESELLDSSTHRRETSRLSCQLILDDSLDGIRVTIAPEE